MGENRVFGLRGKGVADKQSEESAGVKGCGCPMGGDGAEFAVFEEGLGIGLGIEKGDGCETHDGPVAGGAWIF